MITAERLRQELSYDHHTGNFVRLVTRAQSRAGQVAGYVNKTTGYVLIDVCGKTYAAHRLAWLYVHGEWPKQSIDHINRDRADNRLGNLRDVSTSQNMRNVGLRRSNTSGVTGVYWHKPTGNWLVLAIKEKKQHCLGYFRDWFDAVCARKSWEASNPA